jgi:phosphate-selective porin
MAWSRGAAAQQAPPPPITIGRVTLAGYVQMDYLGTIEREPDGLTTEPRTGFFVARARVGVSGALGPRVTWSFIGDFARPFDDSVLRDASVTIRVAPAVAVRFGQYTIPYSLERTTSTATLEIIDRSVMGTLMVPSRDIGLTVFSPTPIRGWLSYSTSIINGSGQNRADDNGAKDVVGRVTVRVPRVTGLTAGVSGEAGKQPIGDRHRAGVDLNFVHGPFRVAVEALSQTYEGAVHRETTGHNLLAVWHHPATTPRPWFAGYELAARWVDVDDDATLLTTHTLQFGGNYYVTPQLRIMNNLVVPIGNDQPRPRTRWWSRVQVVF